MKRKQKISILLLLGVMVVMLIAFAGFYFANGNKSDLTESEAISLLKAVYPEFKNYPNDNLPPQSIRTKQASNGWYVAFVQEGSGRPILEAKCFLVGDDKSVASIGVYVPEVGDDSLYYLSDNNIFSLWIK